MQRSHQQTSIVIHRQNGFTFLKVIVALVVLMGTFIVFNEYSRSAGKPKTADTEAAQKRAAENTERLREEAAQREREELEKTAQKNQQSQKDLLAQALGRFDDVMARWNDADRVAGSSARIALAQPVSALQALQREASQLNAPPCLVIGKDELVAAMRESVDGYIAFMQNTAKLGTQIAQVHFEAAAPKFEKYKEIRAACPAP